MTNIKLLERKLRVREMFAVLVSIALVLGLAVLTGKYYLITEYQPPWPCELDKNGRVIIPMNKLDLSPHTWYTVKMTGNTDGTIDYCSISVEVDPDTWEPIPLEEK